VKQCVICKATIEKGTLCEAHAIAKTHLEEKYQEWKRAFGKLTKKEYYQKLVDDSNIPIGDWAREVAEYFLKEENKKR